MTANPNIKEDPRNTPTSYHAEDCNDSRFFIEGSIRSGGGGALDFIVVAQLPDGTRGAVSGTELFDAMWDHLGASARVIEGNWSTADPNLTTNLSAFNAALRSNTNLTERDAALNYTPTGNYARNKGFTNVSIVQALPVGQRGNYTDVVVRFAP
jgi:hypothetical protein